MKKFLKILGFVLGIIILVIVAALLYVKFSPLPTYEPETVAFQVDNSPENIQAGANYVATVCGACHRSEDGRMTGYLHSPDNDPFGKVYAPNITQHPEAGIGEWSASDLAVFLRTGVKPDGSFAIQPWMPKWPILADEDLNDIIAYLKSDARAVQASDVTHPEPERTFLNKMLSRVAFKPYPYLEDIPERPDTNDLVGLGKYLVNNQYLCFDCHSAAFETNDPMNPVNSEGYLGGGIEMPGKDGSPVLVTNITMSENGIGDYSYDDFINAVKWGKAPDRALKYPMLQFTTLSDRELESIWAYLKTVEAI